MLARCAENGPACDALGIIAHALEILRHHEQLGQMAGALRLAANQIDHHLLAAVVQLVHPSSMAKTRWASAASAWENAFVASETMFDTLSVARRTHLQVRDAFGVSCWERYATSRVISSICANR